MRLIIWRAQRGKNYSFFNFLKIDHFSWFSVLRFSQYRGEKLEEI